MTQWAPVASVLKHRRPRRHLQQLPPQHLRVMMKGSRWKKCIMKKWASECPMRLPLHPHPAPDRRGAGITQASNRRRGWWKRTGLRRARGGGLCPRRPAAAAADPGASLASVRGSTEDCIQLHQHKNTAAVGRGYWRKWEVKLLLGLTYIVMYVSLYSKYSKTSQDKV